MPCGYCARWFADLCCTKWRRRSWKPSITTGCMRSRWTSSFAASTRFGPRRCRRLSPQRHQLKRRSNRRFRQRRLRGPKHLLEPLPERDIDIRHGQGMAEIGEAGDAVAWVRHPAGHDGVEVGQIGLHIDRDAVERHPAPQPHPDGGDLVFEPLALVGPADPYPDAILAA